MWQAKKVHQVRIKAHATLSLGRLNNLMVLHIHRDKTYELDVYLFVVTNLY